MTINEKQFSTVEAWCLAKQCVIFQSGLTVVTDTTPKMIFVDRELAEERARELNAYKDSEKINYVIVSVPFVIEE